MIRSIPWVAATWVVTSSLASSAVTVIDSFTSGAFSLSLGGSTGAAAVIESPFGLYRSAGLRSREAPAGAKLSATLDPSIGNLSFLANRTGVGGAGQLRMSVDYAQGGPYSLAGFSSLELDFSEVLGKGSLVVEIGQSSAAHGPSFHRLAIDAAGVLTVPLDQVNVGDSVTSLDFFHSLHFTFESQSDVFSFTLNEIRAVPEPSTALLTLAGAGALLGGVG